MAINLPHASEDHGSITVYEIPWKLYFSLAALVLLISGMLAYVFQVGDRMSARHAPLVDAAMEIKLQATTAHLWFEEIISGDKNEKLDTVWNHLDQAQWYAQAMLKGGRNPEGNFQPLNDPGLRKTIEAVQAKLTEFRTLAEKRLASKKPAGVGSPIDQEFDKVFNDFITRTDQVETAMQHAITSDRLRLRVTQIAVLILSLGLLGWAGELFRRHERRQGLNQIRQQQLIEELENKNAELERFTYTVSHDLKSPLITIKGFLGLLEQDMARGHENRARSDMARIAGAADKMQVLLDELLELSRIGRLTNPPQEVSLGELAREAVELVHGRLEEGLVTVKIASDLPRVWVDRARLLEVMQNLLDNAAKFMGDQPEPRVEVGWSRQGDENIFSVADNGMGIDPHYIERVFKLFEQLNQDIRGTGIGLTLVKRIIETHGGKIWAESPGVGRGAVFYFTLPRKGATHNG